MERLIPITLKNVDLTLQVQVDDSECTLSEILDTVKQIQDVLTAFGKDILLEQFTKILPKAIIQSLAIARASSPNNTTIFNPNSSNNDIRDYVLKSHGLAGQQIKRVQPESLFSMLDLCPWTLLEEDKKAIQEFRQIYRKNAVNIQSTPISDDEIPF